MNPTQQNLIDSYLRNELSDADRSLFEHLMESDPAFREDVRFEKHVKEGIGRYRRAELKARMDAIEVSPGWINIGQLGSSTLMKTVGGLITAGIVGTAGYFLVNTRTEEASEEIVTENSSYDFPEERHLPVLVLPEISTEEHEPEDDLMVKEIVEEAKTTTSAGGKLAVAEPEESGADEQLSKVEFLPQVDVPGLNEVESEEATLAERAGIPEASSTDEINSRSVPLDVETVSRKTEVIKYKYFDGKLYLYGDFKRQPYEILEINSVSERNIYVYHNSSYYQVNLTDKVEELPQITNEKLIRELEILRNNKLSE